MAIAIVTNIESTPCDGTTLTVVFDALFIGAVIGVQNATLRASVSISTATAAQVLTAIPNLFQNAIQAYATANGFSVPNGNSIVPSYTSL